MFKLLVGRVLFSALILFAIINPASAHHQHRGHHRHHTQHHRAAPVASVDWRPLELHPLIAVARADLGARNFTGLHAAWCAAAMRIWLHRAGYSAPRSNRAIDFAAYGRRSVAQVGAVAVLRHHIGVVLGWAKRGGIILLSGNHGHRVGVGVYDARRIIAYRQPV